MHIHHDATADLLYLRFDDRKQEVTNRRLSDDIVLDVGESDKIVGIEIFDASRNIDLGKILPIHVGTA
jgi:uncharacterized protein YuzE